MNVSTLERLAPAMGISLNPDQLAAFGRYQVLLLEWNERLNLTAIREPAQVQLRHFLDSLTCSLATGDLNGCSLIDVGAGAGFPGLPLKILYPGLRLTLADSVAKKTVFLEAVVAELGLADVAVVAERAETLGQDGAHREQYDWAIARSVAELRVLAEYLLPLCRVGGRMLAQKGEGVDEEVAAARGAIRTLGGGDPVVSPVVLPPLDGEAGRTHYLVVVEKTAPTDSRYPRKPGLPSKRPL